MRRGRWTSNRTNLYVRPILRWWHQAFAIWRQRLPLNHLTLAEYEQLLIGSPIGKGTLGRSPALDLVMVARWTGGGSGPYVRVTSLLDNVMGSLRNSARRQRTGRGYGKLPRHKLTSI